jgi:hypothetical protein
MAEITLTTEKHDKPFLALHEDTISFDNKDGVKGVLKRAFPVGFILKVEVDGTEVTETLSWPALVETWANAVAAEVRGT